MCVCVYTHTHTKPHTEARPLTARCARLDGVLQRIQFLPFYL
jgi:hypothetical protein